MAEFVSKHKSKQKVFEILKQNAQFKPITKMKQAWYFYKQTLGWKTLQSFSLYIDFKNSKREALQYKILLLFSLYKRAVFNEWRNYTKILLKEKRKEMKKEHKQNRIALKEAFFQWKFFIRILKEWDKVYIN